MQPPRNDYPAAVGAAVDTSFQRALERKPSGIPLGWEFPQSSTSGLTEPVATFRRALNRSCRTYVQKVSVGLRDATYYDVACRDRQGNRRIPVE